MTALGLPAPFLFAWAAGISELVGGVFLAIELLTRLAAFLNGQSTMFFPKNSLTNEIHDFLGQAL